MATRAEKIAWGDAASTHGWVDGDDVPDSPLPVVSYGFVIRENRECVLLAQSRSEENGRYMDVLNIPKGMIKSRRVLK